MKFLERSGLGAKYSAPQTRYPYETLIDSPKRLFHFGKAGVRV
jgi:hypothetical protein